MQLQKYILKEIAEFNRSSLNKKDSINEIKYLDTSSIIENTIISTQALPRRDAPSRAQRKVKDETIIYSTVRPRLKHYGILSNPSDNLIVSSGFVTIDIKPNHKDRINAYYLYLLLTRKEITEHLGAIADSSTTSYPSINPSDIGTLEFPFPDFQVQSKIADVFRAIDEKIALNRSINQTLEAMAKQLYDYWFVQFDFPDKNGKPYKSSGGKMVWNEKLKREIPEGWEAKKLTECTKDEMDIISPSENPDVWFKHYSIPAFDNRLSYELELGKNILSNKFVPTEKDILVSKLNPWTSRVIWCLDEEDAICSTEFVSLAPTKREEKGFFYMLAKSQPFMTYCTKASTGTSHSHRRVSPEIMKMYVFPYNQDIIKSFSSIAISCIEKTVNNINENRNLQSLRDTLLPLLMNGQVTIKN